MANREERFLMRQRGAGARQIDTFEFDLGLPTANQVPLQPVKSGGGRPRKTPQRGSLPPPSTRKTPKALASSKGARASKGSSSSKGLRSSTNSETTKVGSVRRGTRSSSQPTRSDDSGRVTKKRRVNAASDDVAPIDGLGQAENPLPDIQESLQEDAVLEPPAPAIEVGQDATIDLGRDATGDVGQDAAVDVGQDTTAYVGQDAAVDVGQDTMVDVGHNAAVDAESPLTSKGLATRKRKKRKSITMKPRKRISLGAVMPLQELRMEPNDRINTNETASTMDGSIAHENEAVKDATDETPKSGAPPRRRRKRKSIVAVIKSKRKPTSPEQTESSDTKSIDHSSSAPKASAKSRGPKIEKKLQRQREPSVSGPVSREKEAEPNPIPRRRGRPPGGGKMAGSSSKVARERDQQDPLAEEFVRDVEMETHSVLKRRGRPQGARKSSLSTTKANRLNQLKEAKHGLKANQKPKLNKSVLGLAQEKAKPRQKRVTKASEKRSRQEPKPTQRSAESVPITIHRAMRLAEVDSDDEMALDVAPFPKKRGVNAVDVLNQICQEMIDKNLESLEEEEAIESHKKTKKELRLKQKVVQIFRDDLEETLLQMTEATDHNEALKKRLRQAKKDKTTLRNDLLGLQKEVEEVAIEMDIARLEHEEVSSQNQKVEDLNQLLADIELAVERGKAQQRLDMENGNSGDANTMEGVEYSLRSTAASVSSFGAQGSLDQVQDVAGMSETATVAS